ncbi:MAG: hypothetical protein EAZ52_04035 [Alphaproteobacteria bacterium]|nr:MAG: hypothetical protein EAZ66_01080 [Alphaproteobacteria bacterium]TAF76519.1 MAG: hypothetical protein EAZ52_04035 [Alphaproteobacteria bacterium]
MNDTRPPSQAHNNTPIDDVDRFFTAVGIGAVGAVVAGIATYKQMGHFDKVKIPAIGFATLATVATIANYALDASKPKEHIDAHATMREGTVESCEPVRERV